MFLLEKGGIVLLINDQLISNNIMVGETLTLVYDECILVLRNVLQIFKDIFQFLDEYISVSRCLLQGAELSLATGRRYGLIGRNGLGKTTLLKMLASRNLRVPAHISILHVEQEVEGDDTAALQSVLQSDTLREELLTEERTLNARIASGT